MPNVWMAALKPEDRAAVVALSRRRANLGLESSFAETIRAAVKLAASASDEDLIRGEL